MIDLDARVENSDLEDVEVRENVTIHDSSISEGSRVYEGATVKKCEIRKDVDINSGAYLENVEVEEKVQFGPNSNVVGVTHNLTKEGMEHRNDIFKEIKIGENAVIAANSTVTEDIPDYHIWIGSPPNHKIKSLEEWVE